MTDKERVLAVWPRAYVDWFMSSHEYVIWSTDDPSEKILGRGPKKYAAWQNAAESLPSPEPKVMTKADIDKLTEGFHRCGTTSLPLPRLNPECGCMCGTIYNREGVPIIGNGRYGMRCQHADGNGRLQPVAPVGAKEKCPRCESTNRLFRGTLYDRYGSWKCDEKWHDASALVAEPKPTPSTEREEFEVRYEVIAVIDHNDLIQQVSEEIAQVQYVVGVRLMPQPDSSSIPDKVAENCNCWHVSKYSGRRFPGDHLPDCPARDSSSISTERCPYCKESKDRCLDNEYCHSTHWPKFISTEQTFEHALATAVKLIHVFITNPSFREAWESEIAEVEDAWQAAKGQSNDR